MRDQKRLHLTVHHPRGCFLRGRHYAWIPAPPFSTEPTSVVCSVRRPAPSVARVRVVLSRQAARRYVSGRSLGSVTLCSTLMTFFLCTLCGCTSRWVLKISQAKMWIEPRRMNNYPRVWGTPRRAALVPATRSARNPGPGRGPGLMFKGS